MLRSMTGYGRAECIRGRLEATAEIRTLNNRFLDIIVRLPKSMCHLEQKVLDIVRQYLTRGRVNVSISVKNNDANNLKFSFDNNLVKAYLMMAKEIKKKFSLKGKIQLTQILSMPEIINYEPEPIADDTYWECTVTALKEALQKTNNMRDKEGKELVIDFEKRLENLDTYLTKIEDIAKNRSVIELKKLKSRIINLIEAQQPDESRLELELAIIADRLDVTEECVRFHSHNKLFKDTMYNGETPGRKLNFLLQEMNREANTIGAKASNAEISHLVVLIKEEVERIREQVQNIE